MTQEQEQTLRAIIDRGDYACFLPEWVTLDGRFTPAELRAVADVLEENTRKSGMDAVREELRSNVACTVSPDGKTATLHPKGRGP